jgi:hypothetical protein
VTPDRGRTRIFRDKNEWSPYVNKIEMLLATYLVKVSKICKVVVSSVKNPEL